MIIAITGSITISCFFGASTASMSKDSRFFTKSNAGTFRSLTATTIAVNDSNWAGYIIASDAQNPQPIVTNVSASWTVPSVSPSPLVDTYSAIWIGIGGFFDSTLIQTGTEQDSIGGQVTYSAWYELLPQFSVTIGSVSPGDNMNASIQLLDSNTNTWQIFLQDLTSNETFKSLFNYDASKLSAEWIVERPAIGRRGTTIANLADIGRVAISNCTATVGTQNGAIAAFPGFQSVMYNNVQNTTATAQLTLVSSVSSDGTSFTVDTSPNAVPELIGLQVVPLMAGTSLLTAVLRKRWHVKK